MNSDISSHHLHWILLIYSTRSIEFHNWNPFLSHWLKNNVSPSTQAILLALYKPKPMPYYT